MKQKLLTLVLCAALALAAGGCSTTQSQINQYNAVTYVQGVLDELYRGTSSEAYRTLTQRGEEDARSAFDGNLRSELSQGVALRFEVDDQVLSADLRQDYLDLLERVYAKADWSVGPATPLDGGRYCVELTVTPVTFFSSAYTDGFETLREDFDKTHPPLTQAQLDAMTEAQAKKARERYAQAWAQAVYDYLYLRLDAVTTGSPVTLLLLLSPDSHGLYTLSDNDLQSVDLLISQY